MKCIEDSEINLSNNSYLIFGKCNKNKHWRNSSYASKWCWRNWTCTCGYLHVENKTCIPSSLYQNQLKWSRGLNIRPISLKQLEEKRRRNSRILVDEKECLQNNKKHKLST